MKRSNLLLPLLRVERRHVARNLARSLLVVLLVAVPTAAMVGGSAFVATVRRSVEDQRHGAMGLATLRVDGIPAGSSIDEALASLPKGTVAEEVYTGIAAIERPGQRLRARSFSLSASSLASGGLNSSMVRIDAGRAPEVSGEVALSARLLGTLRREVGDQVDVDGTPCLITGVATVPEDLQLPVAVKAAGLPSPGAGRSLLLNIEPEEIQSSVDAWSEAGATIQRRSETGGTDGFEAVLVLVCGGFGFFEASLVIGAAIAVGMRRRQRELGLLGSSGAPEKAMVKALLLSTAALAAVGSLIGVGLGAAFAHGMHPWLNGWTGRDVGALNIPAAFVVLAFSLGVLSAVLSAWIPARGAVRLPILTALSGQRPVPAGSRGFFRAGIGLAALGAICVVGGASIRRDPFGLLILGGAILLVLGLGTLSPWILESVARVAGRLPVPWRLAVRDAGRFRARNAPVVTAVIAGMSISVLLGALSASVNQLVAARMPALAQNELRVVGTGAEAAARAMSTDLGQAGAYRLDKKTVGGIERVSWIVELPADVTPDLGEHAVEIASAFHGTTVTAGPPSDGGIAGFVRVVLGICILTGLVVVFVATTLSAIESAADSKILRTVGAAPGVLRQHAASRAAYLALLGCALAIPAGLVPMAGLLQLSGASLQFAMPWSTLAITAIAMPAIAYAGTWVSALAKPPGQL
jgi:hypothetical protein